MRVNHAVFNSPISDFMIEDKTFEIGGKKKGQKQISEAKEGHFDLSKYGMQDFFDANDIDYDAEDTIIRRELTGEVLKVIRELADQNTTMIIVTHEMAFARDVADHVIFMDDGRIVEQGDPRQVFENPSEERTKQFLSRFHEG